MWHTEDRPTMALRIDLISSRTRPLSRVLVLLVAVLVAIGSQAAAPAQAGAGDYRLQYVSVDGQRLTVRWDPCQAITYRVNVTFLARRASVRRAAIRDARSAARRLSAQLGVPFSYRGVTRQIPRNTPTTSWYERQAGSEIVVAWVRRTNPRARSNLLGSGAIGTGGYVYKTWSDGLRHKAAIGRGFVVLDAARDLRPGFGRGVTRGALLLHEMGHVVGLHHVGARSELMYPRMVSRVSSRYRAGDRAGLYQLGRAQGCLNVPSEVWPDL